MNNISGLPAHPLLVHIPIVLIPVLALVAIAMVARPTWRAKLALPAAVGGVITLLFTLLAASAGENLEGRVGPDKLVKAHAELGDQTKVVMIVFALLLIGLAITEIRRRTAGSLARFALPLSLLAAAGGIVSTVWVIRTGHAGAKSVWHDTPAVAKAGGDGDSGG